MAQQPTLPPLVRGEWIPMSYDEWLAWVPDGMQGEWVDGKGIVFMPASLRHQLTVGLLYQLLSVFTKVFGLGLVIQEPFEVKLWPGGPSRSPDLFFLRSDHLDRLTELRLLGPPDLVAEVLSPDSEECDRVDKFRQYAAVGIPEYLVLDPRPESDWFGFYRLDERGAYQPVAPDVHGRYHSRVLPGFWLDPAWFRQDPLPPAERLLFTIAGDAYLDWLMQQRTGSERTS